MTPLATIRPATAGDLPAVERIYVEAFPAGERKPAEWLRGLLVPPHPYAVLVAERSGVVLGFAVLFVPADPADAALLEYLAVDGAAGGGGVGGRLFARALDVAARPVLVEVERGDAMADRRRAFYRRHGCRDVAGLDYQLPLPAAPPMGLMVAAAGPVRPPDLARWLATVYADVYGQRRDDPRVAAMVAPGGDASI